MAHLADRPAGRQRQGAQRLSGARSAEHATGRAALVAAGQCPPRRRHSPDEPNSANSFVATVDPLSALPFSRVCTTCVTVALSLTSSIPRVYFLWEGLARARLDCTVACRARLLHDTYSAQPARPLPAPAARRPLFRGSHGCSIPYTCILASYRITTSMQHARRVPCLFSTRMFFVHSLDSTDKIVRYRSIFCLCAPPHS